VLKQLLHLIFNQTLHLNTVDYDAFGISMSWITEYFYQ